MTQTQYSRTDSQTSHDPRQNDFVVAAARLLNGLHAEEIVAYDVRGMSQLTDFILIASGTSDRQIKAFGRQIAELARGYDLERFGSERDDSSTWLVLDFINVMVHLFEPGRRAHYDLEMLWGDASRINWRR